MRPNLLRPRRLLIWQLFRHPRPRSLRMHSLQFHRPGPSFRSFPFPVEVAVCHPCPQLEEVVVEVVEVVVTEEEEEEARPHPWAFPNQGPPAYYCSASWPYFGSPAEAEKRAKLYSVNATFY